MVYNINRKIFALSRAVEEQVLWSPAT